MKLITYWLWQITLIFYRSVKPRVNPQIHVAITKCSIAPFKF